MSVFNAKLIRMVNQTLYMLKRQYSGQIVLCSLTDADTDYTTGVKTVQYVPWPIRRAIVLPSRMTREVVASVARISSNKPLAYGGEFEVGDRGFIIQGTDTPNGLTIQKDDWILYRGERYSMKSIQDVCGGVGWMVVARKHPGVALTFHVTGNSSINVFAESSHE